MDILEILWEMNIMQVTVIGSMFWYFYIRLNRKIAESESRCMELIVEVTDRLCKERNRLSNKIDKLSDRIDVLESRVDDLNVRLSKIEWGLATEEHGLFYFQQEKENPIVPFQKTKKTIKTNKPKISSFQKNIVHLKGGSNS